jgi:hypothetical protein
MSRANYYYEALQQRLEDTRSRPIVGWQSYPGFINRHFDQRFRSMRSVGDRYSEVGSRIQQLFTLYGTESRHRSALVPLSIVTAAFAFGVAQAVEKWVNSQLAQDKATDLMRFAVGGAIYLFVMSPIIAFAWYFYLHPRARYLTSNLPVHVRWYHWLIFALTVTVLAVSAQYVNFAERISSAWSALKLLFLR